MFTFLRKCSDNSLGTIVILHHLCKDHLHIQLMHAVDWSSVWSFFIATKFNQIHNGCQFHFMCIHNLMFVFILESQNSLDTVLILPLVFRFQLNHTRQPI